MKSILKKFIPGTIEKVISQDLKRLNEKKKGMGDQAISYVLTGEPATVLSTLSVTGGGETLRLCSIYYNADIERKRSLVFLDTNPYDCDLLARYASVLAASVKTLPDQVCGSDKSSPVLRVWLSEAFLGVREDLRSYPVRARKTPIKGVTPDKLPDVAKACDAPLCDVFELLFWEGNYWSNSPEHYREVGDISSLVRAYPDAAIEGIKRCPAPGREAFLKALIKWKMTDQEPFLSLLFALAGDGAKAVRGAAISALRQLPAEIAEPRAIESLAKGTVGVRAGMVDVLLALGTQSATDALKEHAKSEKTARVKTAIENGLSTTAVMSSGDNTPDDATGYTAIDGSWVDVPAVREIESAKPVKLNDAEIAELKSLVVQENAKTEKWNKENKGQKYFHKRPVYPMGFVSEVTGFLNTGRMKEKSRHVIVRFLGDTAKSVGTTFLKRVPKDQAMRLAFRQYYRVIYFLSPWSSGPFHDVIQEYIASEQADLRAVDQLWCDMKLEVSIGGWRKNVNRAAQKGDLLRLIIPQDSYNGGDPQDLPKHALWPYLADNFNVLDHAFGIGVGEEGVALSRTGALACLLAMPKMPMRYFAPVLEIATGERKTGKADARNLLADVPQVSERLIGLLSDSRQAIRAGAAEWLGARDEKEAIAPLKARLKKEKSELAKAAILTALQQLGEPLDDFIGPTALIREAEAGVKKAKFDKLDWLQFDTMPKLKFKGGKAVPTEVARWWVFLGFKLKQPGGNALFEIYLDQLGPESATALSQWVFDSWIVYDTQTPSDDEANAYAEQNAEPQYKMYKRWDPDFTREQAFAQLRRYKLSEYLNTGAATKGILALASRTPAPVAADRVRAYLRQHGSRTSQASSLLELLAGKGDPVSLQVVIAAATRLKQKGVQAHAGELVQAVADRMNWTMDELADRIIPTAGFDDEGTLDLPCGVDEKPYRAVLGDDLTLVLNKPDGKTVKTLPAGTDDITKASKKQLTASRKELKQVVSMQTARLYEALCGARVWPLADWQRDFRNHPLMRRLIERIVWQGLDDEGHVIETFRPTAEGEYTDVEDGDVDLTSFSAVRIAHGAMMDTAEAQQWEAHLADYEIKPLFAQFGRSLLRLEPGKSDETLIKDREGWVLETFKLRGVATKLGYERGATEDGGWFYEYRKSFASVGITAVISFTGNYLPEENRNAALISLGFVKSAGRMQQPVKLGDVPEVLLSECWNDFHAMAEKGSHDPNWEKTCQW